MGVTVFTWLKASFTCAYVSRSRDAIFQKISVIPILKSIQIHFRRRAYTFTYATRKYKHNLSTSGQNQHTRNNIDPLSRACTLFIVLELRQID
jgi:hypothetical protein